jgi:hypothetical protein
MSRGRAAVELVAIMRVPRGHFRGGHRIKRGSSGEILRDTPDFRRSGAGRGMRVENGATLFALY